MVDDDPAGNAEAYKDYKPQEEAWFKAGLGHSTPVLTTPYLDETYTPAAIVLSVVQATPTGVLGADITTQRVQQILADSKLPAKGFTILVDDTGNIIAYQDLKRVLKPLTELIPGWMARPSPRGLISRSRWRYPWLAKANCSGPAQSPTAAGRW